VRTHARAALGDEHMDRVVRSMEELERAVGTVVVRGARETVVVDGVSYAPADPIVVRVAPGTVHVAPEGAEPIELTVAAGQQHVVDIADATPRAADAAPAPRTHLERTKYGGWYAATLTSTLLFATGGLVLQLVADQDSRAYDATCTGPDTGNCASLRSEHDLVLDLAIASYVVSGIALVALGVALGLDASQHDDRRHDEVACAPWLGGSGGGVACSGAM